MIDYVMSKEFGLDWKKHEWKRMSMFVKIMSLINKDGGRKGKHQDYGARQR